MDAEYKMERKLMWSERPLKVAVVENRITNAGSSGQERVNYELVRQIIDRGHCLALVSREIAPEFHNRPNVEWVRISTAKMPLRMTQNLEFARRTADWIRRNRSSFDIVHVNGFNTYEPGDVNTSHFVHSAWLRSPAFIGRRNDLQGFYRRFYTGMNSRWEMKAYLSAKIVVAVSERVREELIQHGMPADRVRVILNGVDIEMYHPNIEDRVDLGLPDGVPLGLFVGDLRTTRKNLDGVLKAMVKFPELHMAVVGSTERSPFPQMAADLGVAARTHFLGYRRDIARLMRASDIYVFPSRYEACSLVLLEAMASGLPIVTAVTAGGAELVGTDCGVVISDPEDIDALRGALCSLIGDPKRLDAMAKAARKVAEMHSWRHMATDYMNLYHEICGQRSAAVDKEAIRV